MWDLLMKYLCPRDFRRGEMEENMNKVLITMCFLMLFPSEQIIIHASPQYHQLESQIVIQPLSDKLVWHFKTVNGKINKRLYNATLQKWETDWILVK